MSYITDTHASLPMSYPIALKTFKQNGKDRLISNIDFNVAVTVRSVDSMEGNAGAGSSKYFPQNSMQEMNQGQRKFQGSLSQSLSSILQLKS